MMTFPQKILFLNPPSVKPVFRDCYCSGFTKGTFNVHPFDLQVQSGFFSPEIFEIEFIDAVFEKLSFEKTIYKIKSFSPDIILSLVGGLFLEKDAFFLNYLTNEIPLSRLFISGDIARFKPQKIFNYIPCAEGVLMDFATSALVDYLNGKKSPYLITKKSNQKSNLLEIKSYKYPLPREEFIHKNSYLLPFFHDPKYYSIGTSYGCPYTCHYCNTHLLGFRLRPIEDIISELHFAAKMGYKSLYIRAATFMADKTRSVRLFEEWKKSRLKFEWICFSRPDLLSEELVAKASQTGCSLMMLGVESFDEKWLNKMNRPMSLKTTFHAFHLLKKYRIKSAAQIMLGMHNQSKGMLEYEKKLLSFLNKLDPDYVSFNVFSYRPGIEDNGHYFDNIALNDLSYKKMAHRLEKSFYFHPRNIIKQLYHIKSPKKVFLLINTIIKLLKS